MKNPTLPPGANSATAISIAIPSPTAAIEEVLVRWHKASVPQSLDGYYASPGIDPDHKAAFESSSSVVRASASSNAMGIGPSGRRCKRLLW